MTLATEFTEKLRIMPLLPLSLRFVRSILLVSFLCVLCGKSPAQDFKKIHDGVEYAQVEYKIGDDPLKINLLRLDLKKVRLDVHHALDKAIGLETTSSIATRKNAVAAINAGFFRLDKSEWAGDAAGPLMLDNKFVSEATNNRIALVLINNEKGTSTVLMQHLDIAPHIAVNKSDELFKVGINRERKENDIVLYSDHFGATTMTPATGVEIVLTNCKKEICRSLEIRESGNSTIPVDGYVLSLGREYVNKNSEFLTKFRERSTKDSRIRILNSIKRDLLTKLLSFKADITNGVPQLIKNGKIDITWEQEKASKSFVETRHPRTAVAKLKNGKFLMMTVDGRQPGVSVGMSLQELAEYLLSIGAVDAMNLDGGGSTTMFLDGKVVNKPSDKEGERKIGDAIVVTLRKKK